MNRIRPWLVLACLFLLHCSSSSAGSQGDASAGDDGPILTSDAGHDGSSTGQDGSSGGHEDSSTGHDAASLCSASAPCAIGCCSASGTCGGGTDGTACGKSGTCTDCSQNAAGTGCVGGATCGCNSESDCPEGQACDTATHACGTTCSDSSPCNSQCCNGGTCTSTCTGSPTGPSCVGTGGVFHCGCTSATDCGASMACDTTTHLCTTACNSTTQPCNGGCCNSGTCAPGNTDAICGGVMAGSDLLGVCTSCPSSLIGGHCTFSSEQSEYACGACSSSEDCNAPATCPGGSCCLPSQAVADPANPQFCCSDVVENGLCQ